MNNKPQNVIEAFVQDIINGTGGWKSYEDREFVYCKDRDVAIASWVIRCLANIENSQSGPVMEAIRAERGKRTYRTRLDIKRKQPVRK